MAGRAEHHSRESATTPATHYYQLSLIGVAQQRLRLGIHDLDEIDPPGREPGEERRPFVERHHMGDEVAGDGIAFALHKGDGLG